MTRHVLPEKPILDRIAFAESAVRFYTEHGSLTMAKWSQEQADLWRGKLEQQCIRTEASAKGVSQ